MKHEHAHIEPEPDLDWLLTARDAIQRDLLDLFELVKKHGAFALRDGDMNDLNRRAFALLVGATFSLWRAVFLSDIARDWTDILQGAKLLLEELLVTNTLHFSTERSARDWMFGYYVKNAIYRVAEVRAILNAPDSEALVRFQEVLSSTLVGDKFDSTLSWSSTQSALRKLTALLRRRIEGLDDAARL